jgi:hypothetical protein
MIKPLESISLSQAKEKQFKLVDAITRRFKGAEFLNLGDLGVPQPENKPHTTKQAEEVIADFFNSEAAVLVRGSGTGAIRSVISTLNLKQRSVLVHTSPVYPTTKVTLTQFNLKAIAVDFHDEDQCLRALKTSDVDFILIQTTRQSLDDHYDLEKVITFFKAHSNLPIIVDDNYAVLKTERIGVECGANASAFSAFKLLGPEGIGIVVGDKNICEAISAQNYSGGSQVQGYEALEVLRGMVYAPVALAIQAEVNEECVVRLNNHEVEGIKEAFLVNAQSKVLIVSFNQPIAQDVLKQAQLLGAAPHPVGAESKYEIAPMFYRVSNTFSVSDPNSLNTMIRINPMRSGADTIIRILKDSIENVNKGV